MNNPVFYLCNTNRKNQFLIETKIIRDNNKLVAVKNPLTKEANIHTKNMENNYKILKKFIPTIYKIANIKLKDNAGYFEFIEGVGADRIMIDLITDNKISDALNITDKVFELIDSLPSEISNPTSNEEYAKVFGNSFNGDQECTKIGIVDINLDNFIINNNEWHLIDYEWLFDFSIPTNQLKARILYYFITRYQESFTYHAFNDRYLLISENIIVPEIIYTKYKHLFSLFNSISKSEYIYQKYVNKIFSGKEIKFFDTDKITEYAPKLKGLNYIMHEQESLKINQTNLKENLKGAENQANNLKAELSNIKNSRSYRISLKLSAVVNKLRK